MSDSSELFSYTTTYANFMSLDQLLSSYYTNTLVHAHKTYTHTHTDSEEYSVVAICQTQLQKIT